MAISACGGSAPAQNGGVVSNPITSTPAASAAQVANPIVRAPVQKGWAALTPAQWAAITPEQLRAVMAYSWGKQSAKTKASACTSMKLVPGAVRAGFYQSLNGLSLQHKAEVWTAVWEVMSKDC